ncbi:MAG: cysteine desulfurase [Candidatus Omnitrophota bacterium]|jgi:cysteine desulfurase/selenocysteine lyase
MTRGGVYDVGKIRKDFPVLSRKMNGRPLVYLDNAATAQKPACVIDTIQKFYREEYATIHRGVYSMSQEATERVDAVREICRRFLTAERTEEVLFVRGATEAINLVAAAWGRKFVGKGDEVIISAIEHHANIVPWQRVCAEKEAVLRVIPVNDRGELLLDAYRQMLSDKVKMVAVTHMSNALGTVNPIRQMARLAHGAGALFLADGAQGIAHQKVDVRDLGCDFYAFSSHKIYGPTGIGVLYGKLAHLESMDPYQTGGDMIESVTFEKTTFAKTPRKFEAGTPAIAEILGLGAALDYVGALGIERIEAYEQQLLETAIRKLSQIPGVRFIGTAAERAGLVSFLLGDIHPHDVGTVLDQEGVAVRSGHHCAQPVMNRFKVPATVRASFGLYNTVEEIDALADALGKVGKIFA